MISVSDQHFKTIDFLAVLTDIASSVLKGH